MTPPPLALGHDRRSSLIVALYVWTALALSAVFRKSGEQAWKAWVPILNQVVLLQLGGCRAGSTCSS